MTQTEQENVDLTIEDEQYIYVQEKMKIMIEYGLLIANQLVQNENL